MTEAMKNSRLPTVYSVATEYIIEGFVSYAKYMYEPVKNIMAANSLPTPTQHQLRSALYISFQVSPGYLNFR
jgi:hypothetical protein